MPADDLLIVAVIFLFASMVGVITGSNSLITVPVLLSFGVPPKEALATNMFALTFLSLGGAIPFIRKKAVKRTYLPAQIGLTLLGSLIGALLILAIAPRQLPWLISLFMIAMVFFTLMQRRTQTVKAVSPKRLSLGYGLTFVLGIYGGFYSGGYVTLLTAAFVAFFGMSFLQAVATTKVVNIFSSLIATLVLIYQGLVNFSLGILLAGVMFAGAWVGAHLTLYLPEVWIRRIFLITVLLLAFKMLVLDLQH